MIAYGLYFKVGYEVLATPLTYAVIDGLKRAEGADAYDRHENFNPFSFTQSHVPKIRPPNMIFASHSFAHLSGIPDI